MKKLLLASVGAMVIGISAAHADDMNWSGIILGIQGGYGTGDGDPWTVLSPIRNAGGGAINDVFPGPYNGKFDLDGAAGGVNAGYNFQSGQFVYGGELALNVSGISDTYTSTVGAADDVMTTDVDFFLTAAAKLGYSFDNTLIYAKGGYAGGSVETFLSDSVGTSGSWSDVEWHHGYVVGAGVDHAFDNGAILGFEYNFVDLGSATHSTINVPVPGPIIPGAGAVRSDVNFHTFMAKISFKLDRLMGN